MGQGRVQSVASGSAPLTRREAEAVVEELRYRYGLGQAYRVFVLSAGRGQWEVVDGLGGHEVVPPMDGPRLRQWFWDRYGDVIVERQQTSEG